MQLFRKYHFNTRGMRRAVKNAWDIDGLSKNTLEINRWMTWIMNPLDYVLSKKEREGGK